MLLQQRINLLRRPEMMIDSALRRPTYRRKLNLLTRQLGAIHRLTQHLDRQLTRLLQTALLVVVLLQQTLRAGVVRADARGFPAAVVSGGVGLVELEVALVVPAGVEEGDAERTQATVLGVALLEVAEAAHELFAGDVGIVGEQVALRGLASVVDEDVGVGGHACDGADHVAVQLD